VDAAVFEQVYGAFQDFHAYFAPLFGRREARDHSRHYLQALLVQSGERRNAENLSETVPASARVMQRFLTESPWDDDAVIGRLQEYLSPRLGHPEAVWVLDGSDFPKQGRKSAGVARQYCGRLGKVANCQAGMFLAYVSPLGRALVDQGLYLPESWTSDDARCAAAGVPEDKRRYRSKTELALELLERALGLGHLRAGWVAGDDAFGMSPSFRDGLAALGMRYVLDVPGSTPVWPLEPAWTSPENHPEYQGSGRPRKPKLRDGQRRTMEQRSDELPDEAWREITVAQQSQGPRTYQFSAQRARATKRDKPGEEIWVLYRRNPDGSEPRYYLSNAPEDTTLEKLAYVGGSRWRIETEFETEKGDVGLDEYEARSWAGWHHHIAMCLLGGAFLLGLQQDWGEKDAPDHEAAGLPGGAGNAAPGTVRAG
jgi:SRSO17 transposase